jgi:SAM-dependent methyltransferase
MSDAFAPDGSPVLLYSRLDDLGESAVVHDAVPAGSEILELGAGAGRLTRELARLGHPVVAVDQSPSMLARIEGAETVLADIETLELERRFPVVLLASNFVNDPDRAPEFLACCARHVRADGQVILQRYPPDWRPDPEWHELGHVRARLRTHVLDGSLLVGEMEYVVDGTTLRHRFRARLRDDAELDHLLAAARLERRRTLDELGAWVEAVPAVV